VVAVGLEPTTYGL